jgi:hypothetical protein
MHNTTSRVQPYRTRRRETYRAKSPGRFCRISNSQDKLPRRKQRGIVRHSGLDPVQRSEPSCREAAHPLLFLDVASQLNRTRFRGNDKRGKPRGMNPKGFKLLWLAKPRPCWLCRNLTICRHRVCKLGSGGQSTLCTKSVCKYDCFVVKSLFR